MAFLYPLGPLATYAHAVQPISTLLSQVDRIMLDQDVATLSLASALRNAIQGNVSVDSLLDAISLLKNLRIEDAKERKAEGTEATMLRFEGFVPCELRGSGYSAAECRQAGFTVAALRHGGYTAEECLAGGYSSADCKTGGELTPAYLSQTQVIHRCTHSFRAVSSRTAPLFVSPVLTEACVWLILGI